MANTLPLPANQVGSPCETSPQPARLGLPYGVMSAALPRRPSLRVTITAALAIMAGGTALVISWLSYRDARKHLLQSYRVVLAQVAERISERAQGYLGPVKNAAAINARLLESRTAELADADEVEALLFSQMAEYHHFASLDLGTAEGAFLMVKRMPDRALSTQTVRPGKGAMWRVRAPLAGLSEVKETRPDPSAAAYDPRIRPWYRAGLEAPDVGWIDVYALATDRLLAVSAARAIRTEAGPVAVVAASLTLDEIDKFLSTLRIGHRGRAFVVDRGGRLVGHPDGVVVRADESGALVVPPAAASRAPSIAWPRRPCASAASTSRPGRARSRRLPRSTRSWRRSRG
ncbi:MAG TPA: cache domain-containing protein [Candidatus Thermoplasmatota archaeon]